MRKHTAFLVVATMLFFASVALSQNIQKTALPVPTQIKQISAVDGDTVWKQQCSRCHLAPGAISKAKMMTVNRHMRDVAQLTYEDYQALKEFLER